MNGLFVTNGIVVLISDAVQLLIQMCYIGSMRLPRTLIVGDVHGCLDELKELLVKLQYEASDRLIFVGDLIHKGPYSKEVLEFVVQLNAECIVGNHELRFIKSCRKPESDNPETLRFKSQLGVDLDKWLKWMEALPAFIDDDEFLLVHAGVVPHQAPQNSSVKDLANIRTWDGVGNNLQVESNPPWFEFYKQSKLVVFGHWAKLGLLERENAIGLDSGCVYGKQLSALILPERKIVQVNAKKSYVELGAKLSC